MEIKINDYYEPDHFRAIMRIIIIFHGPVNMRRTRCTTSIIPVRFSWWRTGCGLLYLSRKYHVEPYDILVIGAMEHHLRRIDRLPFSRYGFTAKPTYYRSIILDHDLQKVFGTPPAGMLFGPKL